MIQPERLQAIENAFGVLARSDFRDETTLRLHPSDIRSVCLFCRETLGFDYLLDISSIDHGENTEPRFEVVYELYSLEHGEHLRLKISIVESEAEVDTVSDVWPTADWHEREIWDMMGIRFKEHPDLRRILMWEGYPFFPLRKDFPLEGKPSEMPDLAFTGVAPLAGGPFVTCPSTASAKDREPRSRAPGNP